jgi:hypothetical protein
MEYISLPNLQNTYPSIINYEKEDINLFSLKGIYSQNEIDFVLEDIKVVTPVEDTFFRFVMVLRNNRQENDILGIYTSTSYYNDLITSYDEFNPYFINASLRDEFLINVYVDDYLRIYTTQIKLEKEIGVKMEFNTFYDSEGKPDYIKLVKYIDWVVTEPKLEEVETDGVIPLNEISTYKLGKYNYDTNQWGSIEEVDLEIIKRDIQDELTQLNIDIKEVEDYLRDPENVKLPTNGAVIRILGGTAGIVLQQAAPKLLLGIFAKLGIGAALGPVGIIGAAAVTIVTAVVNLFKAKQIKKKEEEELESYINKLKIELIKLKQRREVLLKRLEELD